MLERIDNVSVVRTHHFPTRIMAQSHAENLQELTAAKPLSVSFREDNCVQLSGKGAFLLLDFGKELCGGIRLVTQAVESAAGSSGTSVRLTFGESVSEACSRLGEKGASNDHATRDMVVHIPTMSDLTFGQTGFRFVRIELLEDKKWHLSSIAAVNVLPYFPQEASIRTNDPLLNQIIETAAYTLKLNFQNGYIWDGIKRDRLIWCGDLHPEILTSLYLFGKTSQVTNSLDFLQNSTPAGRWINEMPTYSAWWVVNLCDYTSFTGDQAYFEKHCHYAEEILAQYDALIDEDGTLHLTNYFLDWPTCQTEDAPAGAAALLYWTAAKYLSCKECAAAASICRKLASKRNLPVTRKQIRAFQVLSGGDPTGARELLEAGGAEGMSTFMAYYILTAAARTGSKDTLKMLKAYYGGMLSRGATSFWEDFDIAWLDGSGRIDELPQPGQKDLHGDFGRYCYTQFRHSLCHGWSSGVLAFIIEHIVGLKVFNGFSQISVQPHLLGLTDIDASFPTPHGMLSIHLHNGETRVEMPQGISLKEDV